LVVGLIIASLAGGFIGNHRDLVQVPPSARPNTSLPTESPSSTSTASTCSTDTVQVLTGAAMGPPADTPSPMPGLGPDQGVIITAAEIWLVGGGRPNPERIGQIKGSADWINVLGISTLTSQALLRIGHYAGPDDSAACADLYLVALDGSGARRLTTFGLGASVIGGAISPDETRVAYAVRNATDLATDVAVLDLTTGATIRESTPCPSGTGGQPITVAWSSDVDRFAVGCNQAVIYDPTGQSPPVTVAADGLIGLGWRGGMLMVGIANASGPGGFHIDAVDALSGRIVPGPQIVDETINWASGSGVFAPGGQRLVAEGYAGAASALYVIDAKGGSPRLLASVSSPVQDPAWSADERSVTYIDGDSIPTSALYRVDVASGTRTLLGPLPPSYDAGAWLLPASAGVEASSTPPVDSPYPTASEDTAVGNAVTILSASPPPGTTLHWSTPITMTFRVRYHFVTAPAASLVVSIGEGGAVEGCNDATAWGLVDAGSMPITAGDGETTVQVTWDGGAHGPRFLNTGYLAPVPSLWDARAQGYRYNYFGADTRFCYPFVR
jgi:hypothetical protein